MSIVLALAAALHHSAGSREKVEMQHNAALRGQTTGRVRCTRRTTLHGDRTHLTRGSGQTSSRSLGRRGATAACGAPQGKACRCSPRRLWQARQAKVLTPARSSSEMPRSGGRRGGADEDAAACEDGNVVAARGAACAPLCRAAGPPLSAHGVLF